MRSPFLLAVALVALAGCASPPPPAALAPPAGAPPGCETTRPAVAHSAAAASADATLPLAYPCLHPVGASALEPTIGVASDGSVFYYPAGLGRFEGSDKGVGVARSRDGGATWEVLRPQVGPAPTHPTTFDPYFYLDPVTNRLFAEDLVVPPFNCGSLSISDDLGETWTETLSGCAQFDHVTIFSGPPRVATMQGYPTVIYRCAISGGALAGASTMVTCQRSIDGGQTWLPPGEPPFTFLPGAFAGTVPGACFGGNGHGATDAEGRVYLPRGHCGEPWLGISEDEGQTWRTVKVSDLGMSCSPEICEHDAGVGVDPDGVLYYAWVAGDRLPRLTLSRDLGATWSEPVLLGAPGVNEATHLQMAVGGPGRIAVVYYGSTTSPGPPFDGSYGETTWNAYMAVGYDAASATPTFQSAVLNDPEDPLVRGSCGPVRCPGVYDFIDIRIGPDGVPWAPLVDACTGPCASGESAQNEALDAVAVRLWGAPSLWGEADPNGPYPDG